MLDEKKRVGESGMGLDCGVAPRATSIWRRAGFRHPAVEYLPSAAARCFEGHAAPFLPAQRAAGLRNSR